MERHKNPIEFWRDVLGAPELIVAPMVDASELAWRILSRRHGAQLCYTPMLHSSVFCRDPKYRKEALMTCESDRPLIVQFCGNDSKTLLEAALLAENYCDAIDINLGCPQAIAKRGRYGAFLQDEWELLEDIVRTLSTGLKVPVTCKIRVFEDVNRTIEYAQMLERAGCQMLTVHGRTREQKGPLTGLADWSYIKAVRESVKIPVFANGNIQCLQDAQRCLKETGAVGVMSAEGNLYNPCIYDGLYPPSWEPALEYLDIVETYPCPNSYIRGHLFKIFHYLLQLPENIQMRSALGAAGSLEEFKSISEMLKSTYIKYHEGTKAWTADNQTYNLELPPWVCQSYVRASPEDHIKKMKQSIEASEDPEIVAKRPRYEDADGNEITRKRMRKLRRIQRRPDKGGVPFCRKEAELCVTCPNPMGLKCTFQLCKQCCRTKCYVENLDCIGHRILVKTRRETAKKFGRHECDDDQAVSSSTTLNEQEHM